MLIVFKIKNLNNIKESNHEHNRDKDESSYNEQHF